MQFHCFQSACRFRTVCRDGTRIALFVGWEAGLDTGIAFVLGLVIPAGLLVPILLRLRAASAQAWAAAQSASRKLAALRQISTRDEEDLRFLAHFLGDYPRLARTLHSGLTERQVPAVLVTILQRSLGARQLAVLVRRGVGKTRPCLVVAACHPSAGAVRLGTEVPLESGEIAFVAESQTVVNRQDLDSELTLSRIKPGPGLAGLPLPDLIAPIVFDQETLGVIVVSGANAGGDAKAALRLVAQSGALALHTAAQVSRMRFTAEVDGLTRAFNKNHIESVLDDFVYRAARTAYDRGGVGAGQPAPALSVFMLDIDNFKSYNDANGHLAGDELLQELSRLIQRSIRKDDVFGRFGGEEFLLVLPHTNADQALAAAEKIRSVIADHPFPGGEGQPLGLVSISGGVAEYPFDGRDAAGLLRAADQALYEAKRLGRNRVLAAPRAAAGMGVGRSASDARPTLSRSSDDQKAVTRPTLKTA